MTVAILDNLVKKSFSFDVTLQSVYKEPDGTMHVIGIASDDDEDRTSDRMSTKCIHSMAEQCTKNDLPLLDNHRSTFGFGYTHSAQARKGEFEDKATGAKKTRTELVVDFALDSRFPQAQVLYDEVKSKSSQKQLSIGGFLNTENPKAVRFEENEKGQTVRVIEDITLEHIAATRPKFAAMPRARFVDAIVKDVFGDESFDEMVKAGTEFSSLAEAQRASRQMGCEGRTHVVRRPDGTTVWRPCGNAGELTQAQGRGNAASRDASRNEQQRRSTEPCSCAAKGDAGTQIEKDIVPFRAWSPVTEQRWSWDAAADNAVLGQSNWARYKAAHTWFDEARGQIPEIKDAYKLPHHIVRGGQLVTHWPGVAVAMGALLGARGGTNIPASQRRGAYAHLAQHYQQFDREPPEFKEWGRNEFIKFHAKQGLDLEPIFRALDEQEAGMAGETQQTTSSGTAVADKPEGTPPEGTPPAAPAAGQEQGAQTGEQPAGEQGSAGSEGGDGTPTADEIAEANKAMKRLAQIGKLFGNSAANTGNKPVSKEVKELEQVAEKATKVEGLTEKDYDTVRRIHNALGTLLSRDGAAGQDPEDPIDDAGSTRQSNSGLSEEDVQRIAKAVVEQSEDLRTGQQQMMTVFNETFTDMANKVGEGLEGMALAFKEFVEGEVAKIRAEIGDVSKSADDRLGTLEKVAGVSQRIQGSEAAVATGQAPASGTSGTVEKTGSAPTARKPDQNNPWRGLFDGSVRQQLARRRA